MNNNQNRQQQYKMLALNLAYYRKLRGLSQEALADIIGISRTHLSNIEATGSDALPSLDCLFDIAEALNVSPAQLLDFNR